MNIENLGFTERFKGEASMYEDLYPCRVISQSSDIYKVSDGDISFFASVSGKFRFEANCSIDFPVVGDFVMVDRIGDKEGKGIIKKVLRRKSIFTRKMAGSSKEEQGVAANIDKIFICMALNNDYNLRRLERYLTLAYDSGAEPIVVLTKADLADDVENKRARVEEVAIDCKIVVTSVLKEECINDIMSLINPKDTIAFVGSSGVGKSTLINLLMEEEIQETKGLRDDDKGRHTTTSRELLITKKGAILIDTPGMREIGVDKGNFEKGFADIEELASNCKFSDCTHENEPGCKILEAIFSGELSQDRYFNYKKLKKESGYEGLNSRQIEEKKLNEMFKAVGGLKGRKNITKELKKKNKSW